MPNPILTVAVPTTPDREREFNHLHNYLLKQMDDRCEFIFELDNKEMSIGEKRQKLINRAQGEYIFQCDSDDMVSVDFIPKVLAALETKPDCVCYFEKIIYNGMAKISCHSNDFADWGENYKEGDNFYHYIRTPFFKDVIKTDICRAVPVPYIRYGEDIKWSRDLKKSGLIKTEEFIPEIMYYYHSPVLTLHEHNKRYGLI